MILVDSSVWIDYFRGTLNAPARKLDGLLGLEPLAIGDLILTEILQGCRHEREFKSITTMMSELRFVVLGGADVAVEAARNFRRLRTRGVTARKTVDTIIATRCIVDGYALLHNDRDFDAFEEHLGLRCVACAH